ncbi:membrane protein [Candidatus Magnetobacterium bavaricum]|uniref:Membrane protein n=1 Tax=Candidatus Magnetobacterium bavaricum TaxID=29290 RepID=A0A0F3GWG7_9BACT|nr:membrane protein [Candidatus Magnetobacterium bavaricum]
MRVYREIKITLLFKVEVNPCSDRKRICSTSETIVISDAYIIIYSIKAICLVGVPEPIRCQSCPVYNPIVAVAAFFVGITVERIIRNKTVT